MSIYEALYEVQKNLPDVVKDSKNPHFKNTYVSLNALMEAVLPALHKQGLFLVQSPSHIGDGPEIVPALETQIISPEGGMVSSLMPLMIEKHNPQGLGSAITYARRYALMSILGIVADEDDDGNKASAVAPARKGGTSDF